MPSTCMPDDSHREAPQVVGSMQVHFASLPPIMQQGAQSLGFSDSTTLRPLLPKLAAHVPLGSK